MPQSGKSKGLILMLDAHSDLITKSSTPNEFQVFKLHQFKSKQNDATEIQHTFRDLKQSLTLERIIP